MNCPRCNGFLVKESWEERCINCGHRTDYCPPASGYRDRTLIEPDPGVQVKSEAEKAEYREQLPIKQERKRARERQYKIKARLEEKRRQRREAMAARRRT